jgi:hypothetical protein
MEYATDESVVKDLNEKSIDEYCKLLVKLAAQAQNPFLVENYFSYKKLVSKRITAIYTLKLEKIVEFFAISVIAIVFILINIRFNELSILELKNLVNKLESFSGNVESISYYYEEDDEKLEFFEKALYDLCVFVDEYNFLLNSVDNTRLYYRYLRTEEYNSRKCGVISIYSKTDNSFYDIDIWVDLENGKILKEESYNNTESNTKLDLPNSYTIFEYED